MRILCIFNELLPIGKKHSASIVGSLIRNECGNPEKSQTQFPTKKTTTQQTPQKP
jgi:hypothetical protein